MKLADYDIKPIALYLSDDEKWVKQQQAAEKYFTEQGVEGIFWLNGVHAAKWGIKGTRPYLLDDRPEENFYIGDANVGNFLSQYIAYVVMDAFDFSHYLYLEGDCEFVNGWKPKLEQALRDVPKDFDLLYVGSCCCEDKEKDHVQGQIYGFPNRMGIWNNYPQCTHCYIIAKKAVPVLIATQRDVSNPTDISIVKYAMPKLKVFAVLPRLAGQFNTKLHP
jgi:hypothetical protein